MIPGSLAQLLEGQHRPGHFAGVVTVVTKLLLQTLPDYAFFGEKDYQQLQLIKRTTRDLDLPVEIVPVPTLRDADGLALSSRNAYLSPEERAKAPMLHATLTEIAEHAKTGAPVEPILTQGHERLTLAGFQIDYLAFCDADTLTPLPKTNGNARILVAARLGTTRLIDNKAV